MRKHYFSLTLFALMVSITGSGCSNNDSLATDDLLQTDLISQQNDETTEEISEDEGYTDAPSTNGKEIIFEDDFENSTGIPDPEKWVLCEKTSSDWARYLSGSYDQAYTKDGSLFLIGEQKDGEYLTGAIETRGKFDFEHGVVQCRARFVEMPMGGHTGIWMMPSPPAEQWPKSGEIDIMEHLNKEDIIYETIHSWYADDMGHKDDPVSQKTVSINKDDWNIYGVEWTEDKITYTVNGESYLEYPNLKLEGEDGDYQWPFNHPFYLILSQSLGGEGTWAGPIDDAELPAIFEIDWIRVLQPHEEASVPMITVD
ncbi:MAG: glycoside hydrolase family 16 protein [Muribaculaceae bacterium]|nr:glycoside hydrolase family 16 protein [Muribaculaceae bacterium]